MFTKIERYLPRLTFAVLLVCISTSVFANTKEAIYSEGIELFEEADMLQFEEPAMAKEVYAKAANRFEYLISKEGIKNGWLHYNLGNTYFRMDELGLAIYNYRMAQKYLPHNHDVAHNLHFAQSLMSDANNDNMTSRYHAAMHFIKEIPTWPKALLFIPLYIIVLLLFLTSLGKRFPAFYKWVGFGVLTPIALLIGLSSLESQQGIIVKDNVTAKKGNSLVYENALMSGLNQGTEFTLLEQRKEWLKIELSDGKSAWIKNDNARIID